MPLPAPSVLAAVGMCLATSVVAILYVAPQPHPTFYAMLVKLLPGLSLVLLVWVSQQVANQTSSKRGLNSGRQVSLLDLYGLGNKSSDDHVTRAETSHQKYHRLQSRLTVGIAWGLFFSMIGDAFLIWHMEDLPFMLGTMVFGAAQLSYTLGFGFQRTKLVSGVITYGTALCLALFLLRDMPVIFRYVLPVYATLISTTLWRAVDRCGLEDGRPLWQRKAVVLGVLLFVASDGSLALFKFVLTSVHFTIAQTIILTTYFLAQNFIVFGSVYRE